MYKRTVSEYNVQSFYIELNYFRMCRSPHSGKPDVSLSFEQRDRIRICWRIKSPRFVKESAPAAICFPVNKTVKLKRMNYKFNT